MHAKFKIFFLLFICFQFFCFAQDYKIFIETLPVIQKLSFRDVIFAQFLKVVEYNDKILADELSKQELETEFYKFTPKKEDDLLSIASRTGIPYDTIATLNGISSSNEKITGKVLVLPTVKGIFVQKKPESSVEILVAKEFGQDVVQFKNVCYNVSDKELYFLPGKRFTSTQRAFFVDSAILLPLDKIQISSAFGYRESPVYGTWKFHKGIDFASPEGSAVYACKGGTVSVCVKNDSVFGNYVILSHGDGRTSVYAHLSKIEVHKGDVVHGGAVIGRVGHTGMATGPHLHFEIRQNGTASDPAEFLKL